MRDCGFEVVYDGIRLTPARIAAAALGEGVHVVGLSILSGSHRAQVAEVLARLREHGLGDVLVVVGGIIPPQDAALLRADGVAAVFTPKDYQPTKVMGAIAGLFRGRAGARPLGLSLASARRRWQVGAGHQGLGKAAIARTTRRLAPPHRA